MDKHDIMLSFKGRVSTELLDSILQIVETKLDTSASSKKVKKKVFNVLVECLQNLYHHVEDDDRTEIDESTTGIFVLSNAAEWYEVYTGNYMPSENVSELKSKIERVNAMSKDELKAFYKEVLNNGMMSAKGGGGLGVIDIARKSGEKLDYSFMSLGDETSFFTLRVKVKKDNI